MNNYVINLERRKDRMKRITQRLLQFNAPVFKCRAVETQDVNGFPSAAMHGCALSHLKVIQGALSTTCERIMVLEDDALLRDDAAEIVKLSIQSLPENWHILHLGCISESTKQFGASLVIPNAPRHMHAYILSRAGMLWLSGRINELLGLAHKPPFDRYVENDNVPKFRTNPICAIQEDGYSDIACNPVDQMYKYFSGRDRFQDFVNNCEELRNGRTGLRITSDSGST